MPDRAEASENPAHAVLADLLQAAVEADRVDETTELLADLAGERAVREAYGVVFDRLATGVAAAAGGAGARAASPRLRAVSGGTP